MHATAAIKRWVLVGLMVSVLPCPAEDAASVLRRVDAHYNHLKTLKARFVERYAGVGMVREESGTLLLAKPGRMRWNYDKPAGKVFVMDGKFGWSYTPGEAQVQRVEAKKIDDLRSPLRFLLGHTVLENELDGVAVTASGGGYVVTGVPRGMGGRVSKLSLRVDSAGLILGIKVEEADGGSTEFSFSEIGEDGVLPRGTFVFLIPQGLEVVDGLPPV